MFRLLVLAICIAVSSANIYDTVEAIEPKPEIIEVFEKLHKLPPVEIKERGYAVQWYTYAQKVDNFNPSDTRTYKQRFVANEQYFKAGGPIFVMVGGEWTIDDGYVLGGQMFDNAKANNGAMYYVEHRYYGYSYPTSDASTANLKYLSASQALADLATFINYQKTRLGSKRVIVFGGSYAANLASWARLKYPNLINGAVASSGPVKAQADFREYLEVVNSAIGNRDATCLNIIKSAMQSVDSLVKTTAGCQQVSTAFGLCYMLTPTDPKSISLLYQYVTGTWSGAVQYAQANTIQNECVTLKNSAGKTNMEKLGRYMQSKSSGCINVNYRGYIDYMKYTDWNTVGPSGSRQWTYQTCTEYGYYQTTNSASQPFGTGLPLSFSTGVCKDVFGVTEATLNAGIANTNKLFQGTNPQLSNVCYVNGDVDPWHRLSILKNLNAQTPAYFVAGTSHCADLSSISSWDSEQMKQAKLNVQANVRKWLL